MKRKTNKVTQPEINEAAVLASVAQTNRDLATSLLIVSLAINLFVLIGWVTLQVTTVYDSQVAAFLFSR